MSTTYGIDIVRDNVTSSYTVSDNPNFTAGGTELVEVADGPMVAASGGPMATIAITLPAGSQLVCDRGNVLDAASNPVLLGRPTPTTSAASAFSAVSFETP